MRGARARAAVVSALALTLALAPSADTRGEDVARPPSCATTLTPARNDPDRFSNRGDRCEGSHTLPHAAGDPLQIVSFVRAGGLQGWPAGGRATLRWEGEDGRDYRIRAVLRKPRGTAYRMETAVKKTTFEWWIDKAVRRIPRPEQDLGLLVFSPTAHARTVDVHYPASIGAAPAPASAAATYQIVFVAGERLRHPRVVVQAIDDQAAACVPRTLPNPTLPAVVLNGHELAVTLDVRALPCPGRDFVLVIRAKRGSDEHEVRVGEAYFRHAS